MRPPLKFLPLEKRKKPRAHLCLPSFLPQVCIFQDPKETCNQGATGSSSSFPAKPLNLPPRALHLPKFSVNQKAAPLHSLLLLWSCLFDLKPSSVLLSPAFIRVLSKSPGLVLWNFSQMKLRAHPFQTIPGQSRLSPSPFSVTEPLICTLFSHTLSLYVLSVHCYLSCTHQCKRSMCLSILLFTQSQRFPHFTLSCLPNLPPMDIT